MQDQEIVDLYWQRDPKAVEETENKYGSYCLTVAQRICRIREDAEECVNDTWLSAWNAMPDKRPERLSPFLGRICRNHALDLLQARGRLKRGGGETALALEELENVAAGTGSGERIVEARELEAAVRLFVSAMKTEERRVFLARYFYLVPIAEIASRCGCRESRIKSMLFRSRKRLAAYLKKEGLL